jgi:NAD(P)-dependent dehydrogenase (short-subunit alcohol dehydrogenase family)
VSFTLRRNIRALSARSDNTPATHPYSLSGRVALVTGSSTGLGKAMALALGRAGAAVALNYHNNTARAEQTFAEFQAQGCQGVAARLM